MKNIRTTLITLLLTLVIFSCGGSMSNDYKVAEGEASASIDMLEEMAPLTEQNNELEQSKDINKSENTTKLDRKLIKTGNVEFETESLNETNARIIAAVKSLNGYVANENEYNGYGRVSINFTVRIPSKNFDKLLKEVSKGVNHFDSKSIDVKDVTEEFVDIQARIKTKKELEARYLQILNKARTVTEILEIEREIGNLRADIESFEGRLKYLKDQVSFSTLDIRFYELKQVEKSNRFGQKFIDGFSSGWENLIWFFIGLTNIWPFILLIVALIWFIRKRLIARRQRRKT